MSVIDSLLQNNQRYAAAFRMGDLPSAPQKHIAIIACMDARMDIHAILGVNPGDAIVLRNAGGVITQDVIRSLFISQRVLGARETLLVHHTDCGMLKIADERVGRTLRSAAGERPPFDLEAFTDVDEDVRESLARLHASPWVSHKESIRGFVYDVRTGQLHEIRMREARRDILNAA